MITLVREVNMENAGIHRTFVKEYNNDVIYYGDAVEVNGMHKNKECFKLALILEIKMTIGKPTVVPLMCF